jgi:hypothetical protein
VDLSRVNVDYTNGAGTKTRVLQDAAKECAQASGWRYSPDKTKIVLCGSTCEQVKNDPKAVIDIVLGCPSEVS